MAGEDRATQPKAADRDGRQGRAAFDIAQIQQDLEAAFANDGTVLPDDPSRNIPPAAARAAARAAAAAPAAPAPAAAAPGENLDFSAKP